MNKLQWQTQGQGEDIVLLHGWGMNSEVWAPTVEVLSKYYKVHTTDLLGHGFHNNILPKDLDDTCKHILADAPENAIYIGWSLGGLVATNIAIHHPDRVKKLITVASSPKFFAEKNWKGMLPKVAWDLGVQLQKNFKLTIDGFILLQAFGSSVSRQHLKIVKQNILSRPMPSKKALLISLDILDDTDLRPHLAQLSMPFMRLYGRLDALVPKAVAENVAKLAPQSEHYIFQSSRHAPFITEHELFCEKVLEFIES